jgi:hypothetical protein
MAKALHPAAAAEPLRRTLTFREGPYETVIRPEEGGIRYTVSNGSSRFAAPVVWAFGQGAAGQTYVLRHEGKLYESRLSYYRAIDGLDLTIGAAAAKPRNVEEAAGRLMGNDDVRDCFGCHATGTFRPAVVWEQLTPGVQCERCHGPSAGHVAKREPMKKLTRLSTEEMSDFCGSCHRTWADIAANGPRGVANVRFQPYRLTNSKCYDVEDRRISCVACHDPHREVAREASAYDARCTACHAAGARSKARPCPVGKRECSNCHMPKYGLPNSHFAFTDHRIRVVRKGESYPD